MRSRELLKVLENFQGFTPDMLYHDLVVLDGVESDFDQEQLRQFIAAYIFAERGELTQDSHKRAITNSDKIKDKLDAFIKKLEKASPDWLGISAPSAKTEGNILKLYLSVDNSDLHYFANRLISTSLSKGYDDFDFKINNNSNMNRRDNVVIYCTEENIGRYIHTVSEILEQSPDIKLNSPHLLGISYDEKITCGVDHDNGNTSHTDKLCQGIFESLRKGTDKNLIVSMIDHQLRRQTPRIKYLVEETATKK